MRRPQYAVFGLVLVLVLLVAPAHAARPLLDYHRLDSYFALYARDANVPWKPASVRLDTYTSAPIDFAVYQADPADVIVAGATTRPRAVDTRRLRPLARWQYTPPGGYRFQSNDVNVPLGTREGFFIVAARRGSVAEQVWINRTRIGLLTKETAAGITLYGADLQTGNPARGMRVSLIVNGRFIDRYTDHGGILTWSTDPRPVFALAQWGKSTAFVSFLPQAPLPRTILAVKTSSAVVHAGQSLEVVGFARTRAGSVLHPGRGGVQIQLRSSRGPIAQARASLDLAGAFAVALHVPSQTSAGQYTVLAQSGSAAAGTALTVDANANGTSLTIAPACERACDPNTDVPVIVAAAHNGMPIAGLQIGISVIRSPHVATGDIGDSDWGLTQWYSAQVVTQSDGRVQIRIPHPSDGLASTYGVRAYAGGANADTRIAVPTSSLAVRVRLDRDDIGSGTPAAFSVRVQDLATGEPAANYSVRVALIHAGSVQQQTIRLDDRGQAHGVFTAPPSGSNLIVAQVTGDRPAMDAAALQVEPQTIESQGPRASAGVGIVLDRSRYNAGETAQVHAFLAGAQGSALITFESGSRTLEHVVAVRDGRASVALRVNDAPGTLAVGAAFVRDGALQWSSIPLTVDAPGRPVAAQVTLDRPAYSPGSTASAHLRNVRPSPGTVIVRVTKSAPTGSAVFETAPELLAIGSTTTQDSAVDGDSWHPWVDSSGDHAVIQTFARRTAPPADLTMTQADTASVYWTVDHQVSGESISFPVPTAPGKYVLSLLKVGSDGRVSAASADIIVQ